MEIPEDLIKEIVDYVIEEITYNYEKDEDRISVNNKVREKIDDEVKAKIKLYFEIRG